MRVCICFVLAVLLLLLAAFSQARETAPTPCERRRIAKELLGLNRDLKYPAQPGIKGAEIGLLKTVVPVPKAGMNVTAVVHYPEKTGNDRVDEQLRQYAQTVLDDCLDKIREDFLADDVGDLSPARVKEAVLSTTFTLGRSSSRYMSVIFYHCRYTGGAHPNHTFSVLSFDLETGARLTFTDLFPDGRADSLAEYMNKDLDRQSAAGKNARNAADILTPEAVRERGLDNLALCSTGLIAIFAPYEQGPYSEGTKFVSIPARGLKTPKGLDTRFWQ